MSEGIIAADHDIYSMISGTTVTKRLHMCIYSFLMVLLLILIRYRHSKLVSLTWQICMHMIFNAYIVRT